MALFEIVVWAIISLLTLTKLRFLPGISIATVLKDRHMLSMRLDPYETAIRMPYIRFLGVRDQN